MCAGAAGCATGSHVERHETRLDGETAAHEGKRQSARALIGSPIRPEEGTSLVVHHQESDGQKNHADVRLDEEIDTSLDDIAVPTLEDDEEETAEGHQFPGHQKGDGMLGQRQQNHRRKGQQVPENV